MNACSYILTQQLLAAMKTTIHQTSGTEKSHAEQGNENLVASRKRELTVYQKVLFPLP